MSKDEKQVCMYCKFWEFSGFQNFGNCRVNGPMLVPMKDVKFPQMRGSDWCGKYADRADDHVTEFPDSWEHISEPVSRVIEQSADAYLNGTKDEVA